MILHEFPDLRWLKEQAETNFANHRGWRNSSLDQPGWPTVILNTKTTYAERPDIKGPLSLFTTISGTSIASVHGHRAVVSNQVYFLSNQEQYYTLEIDSRQPVEIFNIHFSPFLADQVYESLTLPAHRLLEGGSEPKEAALAFYNRLYPRDQQFNRLISVLHRAAQEGEHGWCYYEECLASIVQYLLAVNCDAQHTIASLPSVKAATRKEIYQRLLRATDYIYTHYQVNITLDELASAACLSKFHFLRLFRQAFRMTPYQFINHVRMDYARALLRTSLAVHEIASHLGYENSPAFSRAFHKVTGVYPAHYRNLIE